MTKIFQWACWDDGGIDEKANWSDQIRKWIVKCVPNVHTCSPTIILKHMYRQIGTKHPSHSVNILRHFEQIDILQCIHRLAYRGILYADTQKMLRVSKSGRTCSLETKMERANDRILISSQLSPPASWLYLPLWYLKCTLPKATIHLSQNRMQTDIWFI